MPGAEMLDVAIASKNFAGRTVLADLLFSARPGEVLALLAPSGTGKTTTLRIVLGLDQDFTGLIRRPPGRVGTVFQDPRLLPWLTVAGNIRLVAPTLTDDAIFTFLQLVGLEGRATALPRELSLGMARRVAIARALAVRPGLLVLDEAFASLDPKLATTLSGAVIARARREGAIVLLATHDLAMALAVADRILVLAGSSPAILAADVTVGDIGADALRSRFPFLAG